MKKVKAHFLLVPRTEEAKRWHPIGALVELEKCLQGTDFVKHFLVVGLEADEVSD